MSKLGILNRGVCQWFFMRLARTIDNASGVQVGWSVLFPIVPLTGWGCRYRPSWYWVIPISKRAYPEEPNG